MCTELESSKVYLDKLGSCPMTSDCSSVCLVGNTKYPVLYIFYLPETEPTHFTLFSFGMGFVLRQWRLKARKKNVF